MNDLDKEIKAWHNYGGRFDSYPKVSVQVFCCLQPYVIMTMMEIVQNNGISLSKDELDALILTKEVKDKLKDIPDPFIDVICMEPRFLSLCQDWLDCEQDFMKLKLTVKYE